MYIKRCFADKEQQEYLKYLKEKGISYYTIRGREYNLAKFYEYLNKPTIQASREDIERYARYLFSKDISVNTINAMLIMVKQYYQWLYKNCRILINPCTAVEIPKRKQVIPLVPTHIQMLKVIRNTEGKRYIDVMAKAMLEVLYSTGIRRRELLNLNINDLNFSQSILRINHGKGGKSRIVPLGRYAKAALREYFKRRRRKKVIKDHECLFINLKGSRLSPSDLYAMLRRYKCENRITPHGIRHLCAIGMLKGGADIMEIKELLGHSNITSTQIYTRLVIEDIRRMHRRYHPGERRKRKDINREDICKRYYRKT